MTEQSFLAKLLTKKATVLQTQDKTDTNMKSAIYEVERQIRECLKGGDINKGEGVTKSGEED